MTGGDLVVTGGGLRVEIGVVAHDHLAVADIALLQGNGCGSGG